MNNFNIECIRPEALNNAHIRSWFSYKNPQFVLEQSTISGMNLGFSSLEHPSTIQRNLYLFCDHIGIDPNKLALAKQVHGSHVEVVSQGGMFEDTDGFVTNTPGLALGIQVADCGALLFGDANNRVIGAAHAGWRGAVNQIAPKTVEKMLKLGADPKHIQVFISPCLALHNFEVGEEVAAQFPEHWVDRKHYAKPHVNLSGWLQEQLESVGLSKAHIHIDGRCTIDHEKLFYSYRREKEQSGRMLAVIELCLNAPHEEV